LDGAGVGQVLALPRHRRHDQPTEERSHQAQHKHAQAQQHQAATGITSSRRASAGREHEDAADDGQRHDPEDQADQPDVEPHVAVEDVAELVSAHALQLVAGQVVETALGDSDHGIARGVAGREGIDAGLRQNIDGGHRHSRGEAISSTTLSSRFCRASVVVPGTSAPPIIRATACPPEESWATLNALAPPTTRPTPSAASRSSSGCHQVTGSRALYMLSASNSAYTRAIRIRIARTK